MVNTYAIVENGEVVNLVLWDGVTPWSPPQGCTAVLASAGAYMGSTYDGNTFTPPTQPVEAPA